MTELELPVSLVRRGLYAGSFDPPTNGHLWVIERGAELFDHLHVAVAFNPNKLNGTFTPEERVEMLTEISRPYPNVSVGELDTRRMTARYAKEIGCQFLLRGLRDPKDFEEEQKLASLNRDIAKEIVTIHVIGPDELLRISSSNVKGIANLEDGLEVVANYVPEFVFGALRKKFEKNPN